MSKKEIKEDRFIQTMAKTSEFLQHYNRQIILAVGVIAVVVIATFLIRNKMTGDEYQAQVTLENINMLYRPGNNIHWPGRAVRDDPLSYVRNR
jgi:hypothetical protein